jgi:hypothetical protein
MKLTVEAAVKTRVNLADANLADANLDGANLASANLSGAYLSGANLAGAYLSGANLARANLAGANLARANLARANLADANLAGDNLAGANLADANLAGVKNPNWSAFQIVPEIGAFVCFKKVADKNGAFCILTLQIPEDAKRTGNLINRKCRVSACIPLKAETVDGKSVKTRKFQSCMNPIHCLTYTIGKRVESEYSDDILIDCAAGIHVFITKQEAIDF